MRRFCRSLCRKAWKSKTSVDTSKRRVLPFRALSKRPRAVHGLVIRTSAKVNWTLEVLSKRNDGYHELSTILQSVDLWDRLTVEPADAITLVTSDPGLPVDEGNLVVRAARLLQTESGVTAGIAMGLSGRNPCKRWSA